MRNNGQHGLSVQHNLTFDGDEYLGDDKVVLLGGTISGNVQHGELTNTAVVVESGEESQALVCQNNCACWHRRRGRKFGIDRP